MDKAAMKSQSIEFIVLRIRIEGPPLLFQNQHVL